MANQFHLKFLYWAIAALLATTGNISAQTLVLSKLKNMSVPVELKIQNLKDLNQLLQAHFGANNQYSWQLISTFVDSKGVSHNRYQQFYHNIEVENAVVIIHQQTNGSKTISGHFIEVNDISICNSTIGNLQKFNFYNLEDIKIYRINSCNPVIRINESDKCSIVNKIEYYSDDGIIPRIAYIDPSLNSVKEDKPHVCNFDSLGTAITSYHGVQNITTNYSQSTYKLSSSGRGKGIETKNLNNQLNYSSITEFIDSDNIWLNTNLPSENFAADAHFCAERYYDFLNAKFNRNSIDDDGQKLISYLNYGTSLQNAFWNGSAVVYGSGNSATTPLTTIDVAGHEFTHGMIQKTANLEYSGEPGTINESIADIIGVAVEHYAIPNDSNWLIGEKSGSTLRSFENPELYGQPSTYKGNNWYYGTGDNGGVHINSGFINRWFYLLANGGQGVNNFGINYSVQGISLDDATNLVYHSLTSYMVPSTNFNDFMKITLQSAVDLYGSCSLQYVAVAEAWKAVGLFDYTISTPSLVSNTTNYFCSGNSVIIHCDGLPGSTFEWYKNGSLISVGSNNLMNISEAGIYSVNENRCGAHHNSNSLQIIEKSRPIISISNYQSCEGIPISLNASPQGGVYSVPNPYIGQSTTFNYFYADTFGCSANASAYISISTKPDVKISNNEFVFPENSNEVLLSGNVQGAFSGTGVIGNYFYPDIATQGGPYTINLQYVNAMGCVGNDSIKVIVTKPCQRNFDELQLKIEQFAFSGIPFTRVSANADSSEFSISWKVPEGVFTSNSSGKSYIEFQTPNQSYEVSANLVNRCKEEFEIKKFVIPESNINSNDFSIFPNPTSSYIELNILNFSSAEIYTLNNALGKKIAEFEIQSAKQKIELSFLNKGVYILKNQYGNSKKIIIN